MWTRKFHVSIIEVLHLTFGKVFSWFSWTKIFPIRVVFSSDFVDNFPVKLYGSLFSTILNLELRRTSFFPCLKIIIRRYSLIKTSFQVCLKPGLGLAFIDHHFSLLKNRSSLKLLLFMRNWVNFGIAFANRLDFDRLWTLNCVSWSWVLIVLNFEQNWKTFVFV